MTAGLRGLVFAAELLVPEEDDISLADCIAKAAAVHLSSMKLRGEWSDGDIDYEEGFYLLRHTLCPCVLTENGFMTNEQEFRWLMTEEAIEAIAMTHVEGIVGYLSE